MHTPRRCGLPDSAGDLVLCRVRWRPRRTSCAIVGIFCSLHHLSGPAVPPPPAPSYRQKPSATGEEVENAARCPAGSAGLSQIFSAAIESAPYEAPEVVP